MCNYCDDCSTLMERMIACPKCHEDFVSQLETLRAENEALKAENARLIGTFTKEQLKRWKVGIDQNGMSSVSIAYIRTIFNTIDAKDAQIRRLVEALEGIRPIAEACSKHEWNGLYPNKTCYSYDGKHLTFDSLNLVLEALATIPAEALELAKLEREIHEKLKDISNDWDGSTVSWSKLMDLIKAYESYEARKEAHQDV